MVGTLHVTEQEYRMECLACHTPNHDGVRFCATCGAPLLTNKNQADPLVGATVGGRYRITGVLGEGGMGRVYAGEQQMGTSVRKVAIKTLLSQFARDPQTVARFMREVGTVSELEHPNTIKVFDFGQIEGTGELYIAMEMLQGTALDDALASGQPLSPDRVDRIIGQVCGSLHEAHDKGIVHRDLKPANIYLTTRAGEHDVVKVLDFGIAKSGSAQAKTEQKLTQQGTVLGTPPYMSPEQFSGGELDRRSDIYSLGIVTYEMLTGRLPFEAETPWQWMTQHMSAQPFPFETVAAAAHVPDRMKHAVLRALAKNPAHRPATARDFFDELTLGAGPMSAVGLGSAGVHGIPAVAGRAIPAGRPVVGTQVGTPIFGNAASTVHSSASSPATASMGHPPFPTGGGQAFPAPRRKTGGSAALPIGLGVVLLGAAVGGGLYWKSTQDADTTPARVDSDPEEQEDEPSEPEPKPAPSPAPSQAPAAPGSSAPIRLVPVPDEAEWNAAPTVEVADATKLRCQVKALRDWVRVVCSGKSSSGGTPKRVAIKRGNPATDRMGSRDGTTILIFRFAEGTNVEAVFEWTDASRTFTSAWPKGSPRPAAVGTF